MLYLNINSWYVVWKPFVLFYSILKCAKNPTKIRNRPQTFPVTLLLIRRKLTIDQKAYFFFEKNSFNNRNTRKRYEICSKLTIKTTYLKQSKNHLAIQIHHFMLGLYFFIFGSKGFFYCSRISTWRESICVLILSDGILFWSS